MLVRREKLSSISASTAVQRHQSSLVACSTCLFVVMDVETQRRRNQSQMRVCKSLKDVLMAMAPPWWDGFGLLLYLAHLMSLSQMVEQGIKVVFDSTAGKDPSHMVIKKCGVKIPLVKKNKVYVLPWHVKDTSDFSRRGQDL